MVNLLMSQAYDPKAREQLLTITRNMVQAVCDYAIAWQIETPNRDVLLDEVVNSIQMFMFRLSGSKLTYDELQAIMPLLKWSPRAHGREDNTFRPKAEGGC